MYINLKTSSGRYDEEKYGTFIFRSKAPLQLTLSVCLSVCSSVCLYVCKPLAFLYMTIVYIIHNDSILFSGKRTLLSPPMNDDRPCLYLMKRIQSQYKTQKTWKDYTERNIIWSSLGRCCKTIILKGAMMLYTYDV